jgi:hypothetical protein
VRGVSRRFALRDGVRVTAPRYGIPLATALRQSLVDLDTHQNGDAAARLLDVLPIFVAMQTIGSSADRAFSESRPGRPTEFQPAARAEADDIAPEILTPKRTADQF